MNNLKADTLDAADMLDVAIVNLFNRMNELPPESDEYSNTADQLVKLYKLREDAKSRTSLSVDTLFQVAGSLVGIWSIISYEKIGHVITTKAMPFVMKAIR